MGNRSPVPEQPYIPGIATAADGAGDPAQSRKRQKRPGKPEETPGLKATIAAFDAAYRAAYSARPTWGGKQGAMMKRLVKAHGAEEVQRRIALLFEGVLTWPQPPYDLGVLVAQFDRLVASARSSARVRPSDVLGKVKP